MPDYDPKLRRIRRIVAMVVGLLFLIPLAGVIAIVSWRVRLSHSVERQLAAIRAAGLPTNGDELNTWYVTPPESENAALVITQSFALLTNLPDARKSKFSDVLVGRAKPLADENRKMVEDYVALNTSALERARQGAALPKSRYPVDLSLGLDLPLPHLYNVKTLAQIAGFKAMLAADAGRPDEATDLLKTGLALARSLDSEPIVLSQLVRVSMLTIISADLQSCLSSGGFDDAKLAELSADFAAAEKTNLMARALIGERAMHIPYFHMSWAQINRFEANDESGNTPIGKPLPGREPGLLRITGFFQRDLNFFLKTMAGGIAESEKSPPESLRETKLFDDASELAARHYHILSSMFLPALSRVTLREASGLARIRTARAALAVERFRLVTGRLPEKLGDLVPHYLDSVPIDPFDGAPLRYRLRDRGYVIYSVDRDGHDDGGRERPANAKSTDRSTYDISFTVER